MKFAYADPPYFGMAAKFYGHLNPEAAVYDTIEGHQALIDRLVDEFPDGWALSLSSTNLKSILPLCPDSARVAAWVKPFASFKPNVNPAYAWEPVIFMGGRKRVRTVETTRDWCAVSITLKRGFQGAKPLEFCCWIFDLLGMENGDELHDLFPGSGAVGAAHCAWLERTPRLFDNRLMNNPTPLLDPI